MRLLCCLATSSRESTTLFLVGQSVTRRQRESLKLDNSLKRVHGLYALEIPFASIVSVPRWSKEKQRREPLGVPDGKNYCRTLD